MTISRKEEINSQVLNVSAMTTSQRWGDRKVWTWLRHYEQKAFLWNEELWYTNWPRTNLFVWMEGGFRPVLCYAPALRMNTSQWDFYCKWFVHRQNHRTQTLVEACKQTCAVSRDCPERVWSMLHQDSDLTQNLAQIAHHPSNKASIRGRSNVKMEVLCFWSIDFIIVLLHVPTCSRNHLSSDALVIIISYNSCSWTSLVWSTSNSRAAIVTTEALLITWLLIRTRWLSTTSTWVDYVVLWDGVLLVLFCETLASVPVE